MTRHLIGQGDGLGLGGDDVVVFRRALEKLRRTMDRQLDVAEHDEGADAQLVVELAQGQIALQSGNVHFISHGKFLLTWFF